MSILLQAKERKEAARKAAVFSAEYTFIWLELLSPRYRIVSGIEVVHSIPYRDERLNVVRYRLRVQGGAINFEFDPAKNAFVYPMLDSDYNRAFLASHYHLKMWRIMDEAIDAQIAEMSGKIRDDIVGKEDSGTPPKKRGRKRRKKIQPDPDSSDSPPRAAAPPDTEQTNMFRPDAAETAPDERSHDETGDDKDYQKMKMADAVASPMVSVTP